MEVIKDYDQSTSGLKVVKEGNIIKSYNRMGKEFHFIDTSYLSKGILFHGWIGFRTGDQIKEVLSGHLYEMFEQNKCTNMIIDNRKMEGSFSSVNDWLANDYMPSLIKLGLSNNGVVLPANVFAKLAVDDWDKKVSGFATRNFDNTEAAISWVQSN
ncbi:hypothetical protein [Carboxylicivirga linearis]|uniref:STAS/SEC14 domain-containing protein n=1 Tax=Carboxylicivirga linearis TaxID=1628157 RepID=A0ABS5JWF3_9BACT|nr:hypothetical protein [Carboxylicivirga linearis]MBS2099237.1 hypothetical protein [Carboxylicivirga linearis]